MIDAGKVSSLSFLGLILYLWLCLWSFSSAFGAESASISNSPIIPPNEEKTFLDLISAEATLSVPQPLQVGVVVTPPALPQMQFYLDGGYIQFSMGESGAVSAAEYSIESGTRFYPSNGWWGISLGVGYRNITIGTNKISQFVVDGTVLATDVQLGLSTFYFSPTLEARIRLSQYASLGFGLGVQIAVVASGAAFFQNSNDGTNSNNSSVLNVSSSDDFNRIAYFLLPRITLLRLTWTF